MSPSRQPPETEPAIQRNWVSSMRAPGRRYAEPRTRTTVAIRCGSPRRRRRSAASMIDLSLIYSSFARLRADTTQQLVHRDRQVAHARAGGVEHGVRDRRGRAGDADLAGALDAERVDVRIDLVDEQHVDLGHVGAHR